MHESTIPYRVQLSRAKGWRMPENTVKVDRSTKWGNPFKVGERSPYGTAVADKRHAYLLFASFAPLNDELVRLAREELKGKNLGCWCARTNPYEDECHAAVLLKIANSDGDPVVAVYGRARRP